ncbi:MAG: quinone-interacting membrane-bound oxidoreductase complex subunit QmoC [Desulfovibrionaceae bacterium]|nr:quinone-interacting membrane-bound oxidoreductase complex subunit QmoC [Desulfovibrionaceae bacterium]
MAKVTLTPDSGFARELMDAGGDSLKKCYQCATCAVACPMAPDNSPYPRKEMVWASWGQKDKLMGDPDIWLCHNCGNCAELCPRGAKPADVMSAARNVVYKNLVGPAKVGEWMSSPKGLPMLFLIPAVLWLVVWAIMANCFAGGEWFPRVDGRIVFGSIFYGDYTIDPLFMITFFGALFLIAKGCVKLWKQFRQTKGKTLVLGPTKPWYIHLVQMLWDEVVTHKKFDDCQTGPRTGQPENSRKFGHICMIIGFASLAVVTAIVAGGHWIGKVIPFLSIHTPMPLYFPVKLLANFGAIVLIVGLVSLTLRRKRQNPKFFSSNYHDWYLLGIIWAVALTGLLSQLFRLADAVHCAFLVYYLHLVFVWMLFAYLPWSKLGHLAYRATALLYVRMYGRG